MINPELKKMTTNTLTKTATAYTAKTARRHLLGELRAATKTARASGADFYAQDWTRLKANGYPFSAAPEWAAVDAIKEQLNALR